MSEVGKMAASEKAVDLIESGMIVGLGSGTTAAKFIQFLIQKAKEGLRIQAVASSRTSWELATRGGIEVLDINSVPRIDLTVDGADEIDSLKRMIKGGGGAHVREKILASSSNEMVVIIDESKRVRQIGTKKLPIEVLFFGSPATRAKIENLGYSGRWRLNADETFYVTENGNLLFDLSFDRPPEVPEALHDLLIHIPGVVDTGFFFNLAGRVIIGHEDGRVTVVS
ncbi:MAG: ribose 5-phosphate isomerase A [Chlamydiae bacterium RIFCSPHIGHO2_12_FULL_44_59]|nr:MAG: ribose 5-phosphate isomerase A [Chlamydiae bacterium RIFCSPHIGHO2_01_FULL_44_39]OGN57611.1 MAG: ribose 5-phosphate isomerase A [Chlamydiae bacterium RIFCSPHIGHO2_02_FULL_45_9]OGN60192.1 MAG: ribose 5-phosphate isomerase A [Chlamydiae bacterium RIFCSPHIGHO2_12_FULL_44_59]OGN67155.1 MAG: ribose 5-phosphate isomerase A [Chlamydiae bacterium RIFCSPLOWO2_01_FULL_44_52]OGN67745.1 MAG: ribose 5-phosphate isomerase A [Chlamydiae bacterium RIFCSPLOWO2_02_FULL_45_22]OGN71448.1 MAG: ribose 5-phos